jgi:hypothetical protein
MYSSVIHFNPDEIHNVSRRYVWLAMQSLPTYESRNTIETLTEIWLAMQSLPTHLAEIKWTNSPVPLA